MATNLDSLLEHCSCFSEIHQFLCEKMTEIGRKTVSLVDLGSTLRDPNPNPNHFAEQRVPRQGN